MKGERDGEGTGLEKLEFEGEAGEVCTGDGGTVDVTGIAELTFVNVLLEMVEDILHTTTDLKTVLLIEMDVIGKADTEVAKSGGEGLGVLGDITCQVRNEHRAGDFSVDGDFEVTDGFHAEEEISVVIGGMQHSLLRGDIGRPLLCDGVTASLEGISGG